MGELSIKDLLRAGHVKRWQIVRTVRDQTLAEHSFNVAMISIELAEILIDDLTEGLVRLKPTETLPSRFILYDGKEGELEEARQSLLKFNWDDFEKFKFLHTPKIETVNPDKKIEAVSLQYTDA